MTTITRPAGRFVRTAPPAPNAVWAAYEESRPGFDNLYQLGEGGRMITWDEWRRASERTAAGLRRLGVGKGSRVACVLTNTFDVLATVFGTWMVGGVVVSLPTMRRGMAPDEYVAQLSRLSLACDAELLLLEQQYSALLGDVDLGVPLRSYDSLQADGPLDITPPADDELAFVQYSSGSTSDPKGCMLSMGAISEQTQMLVERIEIGPEDIGAMWLPFSHDMGLFGCVLPAWVAGLRLGFGAPERFLRKPRTWLDDAAAMNATIAVGPNFGLALATRIAQRTPPPNAMPMRRVILGGERIEWSTLMQAHDVLGPYGWTLDTFMPAYGLAENTLSVSMKRIDETPKKVELNQAAAYAGELEFVAAGQSDSETRSIVSCGPPVRHTSIRTTNDTGVGRICVRSTSLSDGYLNDPEKTSQRFVDGELITEDIGFIRDGELYVIGRTDDVIPLGGRNVHARDVELEVEAIEDVRPGCTALVNAGDSDTPRLIVVAETAKGATPEFAPLAEAMADAAFHAGDVKVDEVVFVRGGSLPKTPSGKIQRFRCRQIAEADGDQVVERVRI